MIMTMTWGEMSRTLCMLMGDHCPATGIWQRGERVPSTITGVSGACIGGYRGRVMASHGPPLLKSRQHLSLLVAKIPIDRFFVWCLCIRSVVSERQPINYAFCQVWVGMCSLNARLMLWCRDFCMVGIVLEFLQSPSTSTTPPKKHHHHGEPFARDHPQGLAKGAWAGFSISR